MANSVDANMHMQEELPVTSLLDGAKTPSVQRSANLAALKSQPDEIASYHRTILVRCGLLIAGLVACHFGHLPFWALVVCNVLLYPAIYLRMHDIGHGCTPSSYGWSARFPRTLNPIWGGTRVFALVHREHHQHLGTSRDPWLPYYTGSPLRALFFNLIEPEHSCVEFIKMYGWDRELTRNVSFNLAVIAVGCAWSPELFLLNLLSLRAVHGIGIFFFNFYAHRESLSVAAPIGNYERREDLKRVLPMLRVLWGEAVIDGLIYHNRHHCLGQQHIPVQKYKYLVDTGSYTQWHDHWPIHEIKTLDAAARENAH